MFDIHSRLPQKLAILSFLCSVFCVLATVAGTTGVVINAGIALE